MSSPANSSPAPSVQPSSHRRRHRVSIGVMMMLLLLASTSSHRVAFAHDVHQHEIKPVPDQQTYRPSAVPDRICLSMTETPATAMAITWRTDAKTSATIAQYAVAQDGPDFVDDAITVQGTFSRLETDLGTAVYHEVVLADLIPQTKYLYRVGDGVNWSEWSEFQTAARTAQPFSFVYFGDAQNDIKSHWSRVVRNAFRDAPRAAFFLHAGDLINRAESDAEWGQWFGASGFIHRMLPAVAVPGNHEMVKQEDESGSTRRLSRHWKPTFAFPTNGPESLAESCYYVDYQGVRLVCLNSNEQQAEQVAWLEQVLSEAPGWKIVTHHHPIYSASKGRDNPELRDLWQPIYDKHGVDLVLQGHDHTYARSRMMRFQDNAPENTAVNNGVPVGSENVGEGLSKQDAGGTVYVVSVSGPKMYDLDPEPFMQSSAERTQLYQIISIDGNRLRYRACTATGRPYDSFQLIRRFGKPNLLIERESTH
ncbi:purple acid phosphatase family protein [Crateriforma conspicua]|uniref:Calcineurin-like phosphoesterase n=1 Tax=Crateriforma conspicua TaxID=2527996 RepID=A0A5C5XUP2_9PLAN|nr:metallophosphoesterase family protein [Crateriforma conspicua]TWT65755.1 Calcineurin-like phosphoesterase [Crateriforma conspicua]